jgi:hypothetical protein
MIKGWNDITVRDFIKIRQIMLDELNPVRMQLEVLPIVTKYSREDLGAMPYAEVKKLSKKYTWVFDYPNGDIKERFKFKGRRFRAILDAYKINAGQFIDSTELSKGDESEMIQKLNTLLGILLEEKTRFKKHLTDEEKFEMVLDMPIGYLYPTVVFFCLVYQNLLPSIATYLKETGELIQTQHGLLNDTDGDVQ